MMDEPEGVRRAARRHTAYWKGPRTARLPRRTFRGQVGRSITFEADSDKEAEELAARTPSVVKASSSATG